MKNLVLMLLCFCVSAPSFGAYRVYKLKVTPYDAKGKKKKPRYVLSNLDHIQYESVYGSYRYDRVEIADHWYCPGDTSGKKYCKKPGEKKRPRGLASYDHPKRNALPYNFQPVIP